MRVFQLATLFLATSSFTSAFSLPVNEDTTGVLVRHEGIENPVKNVFEKRRGGGGRGGSSSSSSSSSSSGGSRSSSSSSSGSGVRPSYAGGRSFSGGSGTAYRTGSRSPGGLLPFFLVGGALAFYPGFLYGAHAYNWNNDVSYYNQTAMQQQRAQVSCLCGEYEECGCDENDDGFIQDLIGDGSYATLQQNGVVVLNQGSSSLRLRNPTGKTLVINGSLPNGTSESQSGAGFGRAGLLENAGWSIVVALVGSLVWLA